MNHVKNFEEYLRHGVAKKQTPDNIRAKALLEESDEGFEIVNYSEFRLALNSERHESLASITQ